MAARLWLEITKDGRMILDRIYAARNYGPYELPFQRVPVGGFAYHGAFSTETIAQLKTEKAGLKAPANIIRRTSGRKKICMRCLEAENTPKLVYSKYLRKKFPELFRKS